MEAYFFPYFGLNQLLLTIIKQIASLEISTSLTDQMWIGDKITTKYAGPSYGDELIMMMRLRHV